ncbi:hypothetical protein C0389_01805 [bacterium]|nr:hypothetical protein [bacterium]
MKELNRKKLLIVDDSKAIREGLVKFISGLQTVEIVGEAGDGATALEIVDKLKPDFVTLDIKMPGISGILVLLEIKKRHPNIIVFMLTNFPLENYKRLCQNAGANYFYDKSNEFEKMVNKIEELSFEDSQLKKIVGKRDNQ